MSHGRVLEGGPERHDRSDFRITQVITLWNFIVQQPAHFINPESQSTAEALMLIQRVAKQCPSVAVDLARINISARSRTKPLEALRAMSGGRTSPRRFAPLADSETGSTDLSKLAGVVFDVDGTLWSVLFQLCFK